MMGSPKVGVVIVNWNRKEDVLRCISSVLLSDYDHYQILVVDNASSDGSIEAIEESYPEVVILKAEKNLGFTGGNNLGIHWALDRQFEWVLLLNNDVIIAPDAIRLMVEAIQQDPTIGIAGPIVYHAKQPKIIQSAGGSIDKYWNTAHRGQNQPDQGQYSQVADVQWVTGCALMARLEMVRRIGLLDERFFAYSEEVDWCLRAHRDGWKIQCVPWAHVWHAGVSTDYNPEPYITYYTVRNHLLLLAKHHSSVWVRIYYYFRTFSTLISWTIRPRWRSISKHRNAMWRGVVDYHQQRWGPISS